METGKQPMMHSEPMTEIWGLLTDEQKKKAIADIKQVQEMIKPKK